MKHNPPSLLLGIEHLSNNRQVRHYIFIAEQCVPFDIRKPKQKAGQAA